MKLVLLTLIKEITFPSLSGIMCLSISSGYHKDSQAIFAGRFSSNDCLNTTGYKTLDSWTNHVKLVSFLSKYPLPSQARQDNLFTWDLNFHYPPYAAISATNSCSHTKAPYVLWLPEIKLACLFPSETSGMRVQSTP